MKVENSYTKMSITLKVEYVQFRKKDSFPQQNFLINGSN